MLKTKILIVEDEPTIAQDIEMILEGQGYEVVGNAMSYSQALEILDQTIPHLALLDISLQGTKTGIDVSEIFRTKYKIPYIYLTSYADKSTLEAAKQTHPYGYIVKPFKESDLAPAIEIALLRFADNHPDLFPPYQVINGKSEETISKQEFLILNLLWSGKSNVEIAEDCFISTNTVKSHLTSLYKKLRVRNRSEALSKLKKA